jgi:putative FmdB family regulatory protein
VPTYDYRCRSCGSVTEVIHSMLEDGPAVCERCGGVLRRVLFPTGIIFKGSGFYRNDSRSDASGATDGPAAKPSSGAEGTSGAGTSDGISTGSGSATTGGSGSPTTGSAKPAGSTQAD